jgi:hypothetical protein
MKALKIVLLGFIVCAFLMSLRNAYLSPNLVGRDECKFRIVGIGTQNNGAEAYHCNSYIRNEDGSITFTSTHDKNTRVTLYGSVSIVQWN